MRYLALFLTLTACTPDYNTDAVAHGATLCTMPADSKYPKFVFTTNTPDTCRSIGGQPHG